MGELPRWVKVFAVVGIALAVLVLVALFTGHDPGRHTGAWPGPAA